MAEGMAETEFRVPVIATVVAAVLAVSLASSPASAQQGSLKDFLFGQRPETERRAPPPPVARYVSETGQGFVLDTTTPRPLLRFEGSPEIWVLQPTVGPRGDVIYKNDLGQMILRATKLGGLTLFTRGTPAGASAEVAGASPPIRLQPIGPKALFRQLTLASARASGAARRLIPVEADASPGSSALIGDAAMLASEAMIHLSRTPEGQTRLAQIQRIALVEGPRPSVMLKNGTLLIVVTPDQGIAGRPSSERISYVTSR